MRPACLREAGRVRAERWKFLRSPSSAARDIFAYSGCPQPVPSSISLPRSPRKRHVLAGLLAVGIAVVIGVVIAGSRSFAAIGREAVGDRRLLPTL